MRIKRNVLLVAHVVQHWSHARYIKGNAYQSTQNAYDRELEKKEINFIKFGDEFWWLMKNSLIIGIKAIVSCMNYSEISSFSGSLKKSMII